MTRILNYEKNSLKDLIRNTNVRMSEYNAKLKVFIIVCGICSMGKLLKMREEMNSNKEENRMVAFFM